MKVFLLAIFIALAACLAVPTVAHAAVITPSTDTGNSVCRGNNFLGFPTWYKYLQVSVVNGHCEVTGPKQPNDSTQLDWQAALPRIGLAVLETMLRIAAIASLGFVTYGGFRFIISQGEPENAKSARQTIINALIGLVIALIASATVAFVGNLLTK